MVKLFILGPEKNQKNTPNTTIDYDRFPCAIKCWLPTTLIQALCLFLSHMSYCLLLYSCMFTNVIYINVIARQNHIKP